MKIINQGSGKKNRTFRVKCSCGCEFEFFESEAIPVIQTPFRLDSGFSPAVVVHKIRCPNCKAVVSKTTSN